LVICGDLGSEERAGVPVLFLGEKGGSGEFWNLVIWRSLALAAKKAVRRYGIEIVRVLHGAQDIDALLPPVPSRRRSFELTS